MPYDTPYNRMIANRRIADDTVYSDLHAYSNQMATGRGRFDEARLCFPDRDGTMLHNTAQIMNPHDIRREYRHDGGISHKNMEGCGGVLGMTFRGIGKGVDHKLAGSHRLFRIAPMPSNIRTKMAACESSSSGSESDEDDMDGAGFLDTLTSGAKFLGNEFLKDPKKYIDYGKTAYDFAKPYLGKGNENIRLDIDPFASPMEQAVAQGNAMTSGPIGGKKPMGCGVSGGRRPSAWIQHVKAFAAANKMKYRDALRCPQCKASYHKSGKGVSGGSVIGGPVNDPVNKGKITGLGRKGKKTGSALFAPKGQFALTDKTTDPAADESGMTGGASTEFPKKYMKSTGHKWEGATLGAGKCGSGPALSKLLRKKKKNVVLPVAAPAARQAFAESSTDYATPEDGSNENVYDEIGEPDDTYEDMATAMPLKKYDLAKVTPQAITNKVPSLSKVARRYTADSSVAPPVPRKKKGTGKASDFPIITPARIRRARKQVGGAILGADPKTYSPIPLVTKKKSGGMLKQLMKSSTVSGSGKTQVAALEPVGYPATANIAGYGKRLKPADKAMFIEKIMAMHKVPKTKAAKMLSSMRKTGGAWYDDLWSGIKSGVSAVAPILPFIL